VIETGFEDDVEYGVDDESERIKNGFDIVDDLTQNEEINDDDEQLREGKQNKHFDSFKSSYHYRSFMYQKDVTKVLLDMQM